MCPVSDLFNDHARSCDTVEETGVTKVHSRLSNVRLRDERGCQEEDQEKDALERLEHDLLLCADQATPQNLFTKPVERAQHKSQSVLVLVHILRKLRVNATDDNLWPHHEVRLHGNQRLS
jgi:hypothetical protein